MNFFHVATRTLTAVAALALVVSSANAGTIEIQLSGLNLKYSAASDTVVDAGASAGGNHVVAQSDVLNAAVFLVDGVAQNPPLMTNSQYGDFFEALSSNIDDTTLLVPVEFGTTNGGGSAFGFEWFMNNGNVPQYFLDLEFDQLTYILTDTSFFLTGVISAVSAQQLPYGLAFDVTQPITLAYQSTNFMKMVSVNNGSVVQTIDASGQLTIAGQMVVPEPAAVVMLGSMLGLMGYLRYRWT